MIRGKFLTSKDDISEILKIRSAVFVEEQGFSAQSEQDEFDNMAIYALVMDEAGVPSATGRLYLDEEGRFTIGRVCTLASARGQGLGDLAMRMLLYRAQELNAPYIQIGSQKDRVSFYEQYGFAPSGEPYEEEGVLHIPMRVDVDKIDLSGKCGRRGGGKCAPQAE